MKFPGLYLLLLTVFVASGCQSFQKMTGTAAPVMQVSCADRVINRAMDLHGEAKTGLAIFFQERNDNRLYQAYYAAEDSYGTALMVKRCWDRKVSHVNKMRELVFLNDAIARVIRLNMPDEDSGNLVSIYRDQYEQIFPQDIRNP